ncbi:MAG: hypothetical protein EXR70_03440 [Deltaproteobacteria bacterium]|nr:hypothetical protein [Deltaproteobacteria bacterium]
MKLGAFIFAAVLTIALPFGAAAQHEHSDHAAPAAKTTTDKTTPPALKPAEGASIKILVPTKGQSIKGDKVEIHYKLVKGKRGHHAHAYIDGEMMGMFESAKGTLNGVKPGKHVLELRVVANDHTTELDARDKVEFTVK